MVHASASDALWAFTFGQFSKSVLHNPCKRNASISRYPQGQLGRAGLQVSTVAGLNSQLEHFGIEQGGGCAEQFRFPRGAQHGMKSDAYSPANLGQDPCKPQHRPRHIHSDLLDPKG